MSFSDDYPCLHKLGVKQNDLLLDSDDDLTPLNVEVVTHETVIELFKFMNENHTCTFFSLRKWLARMLDVKENFPYG